MSILGNGRKPTYKWRSKKRILKVSDNLDIKFGSGSSRHNTYNPKQSQDFIKSWKGMIIRVGKGFGNSETYKKMKGT